MDEGRDDIYFFQNGIDLIRITGAVFADLTLAEVGSATQITLTSGTEILLQGIALTDIDASDFDFV